MYFHLVLVSILALTNGLNINEIEMFRSRTSGGYVAATVINQNIEITSNGVPDHRTSMVSGGIRSQNYNFLIPLEPVLLSEGNSHRLPRGIIGVAKNGVPIYNSYTPDCCDAGDALLERFDACWGQADGNGVYYYNVPPLCLFKFVCEDSSFIGVALDGLPIYGPFDVTGERVLKEDLDECHGRVDRYGNYRYHVTDDFPYMIGCFRGTPAPDYVIGVHECSAPVRPCPSANSTDPIPPQPTLPSLRNKRDIGNFLRNKSCCVSADSCDYIYNPNSASTPPVHIITIFVLAIGIFFLHA